MGKKNQSGSHGRPLEHNLKQERSFFEVLNKKRIITYFLIVFFPPVGLYLIWNRNSDFNPQEKVVWTIIALGVLYKIFEIAGVIPSLEIMNF